jgi:magnesium chelatase accessory protein
VQDAGDGPATLLLHGAGAATHSWRDLVPVLSPHVRVLAPDLPGHGFTDAARSSSLPAIARGVADLLADMDVRPELVVGHSAGAAVLARMCLDGVIAPRALVAVNGAFFALRGLVTRFFSPMAKLLALQPFAPAAIAWSAADRRAVARLLRETGSRVDERGVGLYADLAADPRHVAGTLRMMAAWDLRPLERDLPRLATPLVLVVGSDDRTVPPEEAERLESLVRSAELRRLGRAGHLVHEERPEAVAQIVLECARRFGVL